MSDNGSETPIVADVEEVQAVEVEAPKGKMSVEDALQVRLHCLYHSAPSATADLVPHPPIPQPSIGGPQEGHDPRWTRSWSPRVRQGP